MSMTVEKTKKRWIFIYVIAIILFLIGIFYDKKIELFFYNHEILFIREIMSIISFFGEFYIIFIIFVSYFFIKKDKKSMLKTIAIVSFNLILIFFLKIIFARPRPFSTSLDSFPSGHTTIAFAMIPILNNKTLKIFWIIFSFLVAFSRLYLTKHYLTDVVIGGLLGYTTSYIINKRIDKKIKKIKK